MMLRKLSFLLVSPLLLTANPNMKKLATQSQSSGCVDQNSDNESGFTMPYVLNTYARSLAYIDSLETLKGTVLPNSRSCQ